MSERETLTESEAEAAGMIPAQSPELTEDEQIDASFTESDCHSWKGVALEEFSIRRQTAANCLGLRWGNLSPEEVQQGLQGRQYPGMAQDAIIVLYLCYPRGEKGRDGHTRSIEESYAACDPMTVKLVRRRMLDWAEKEGIGMESEELAEAIELMVKIIKEAKINRFKLPKPEGKAPRGNLPGHLQ